MLIFNNSFSENNAPPQDESSDDDKDIISGIVKTEKDSSGKITKINILCSGKSDNGQDETVKYLVQLDPKGIELGTKFNGKNVEMVGIITRQEKGEDIELWIRALSFNETKLEPEPDPLPQIEN